MVVLIQSLKKPAVQIQSLPLHKNGGVDPKLEKTEKDDRVDPTKKDGGVDPKQVGGEDPTPPPGKRWWG